MLKQGARGSYILYNPSYVTNDLLIALHLPVALTSVPEKRVCIYCLH